MNKQTECSFLDYLMLYKYLALKIAQKDLNTALVCTSFIYNNVYTGNKSEDYLIKAANYVNLFPFVNKKCEHLYFICVHFLLSVVEHTAQHAASRLHKVMHHHAPFQSLAIF